MRSTTTGLISILLGALAAAAPAAEFGEFAPRGTSVYMRSRYNAEATKQILGEDWQKLSEQVQSRMLGREGDKMAPVLKELSAWNTSISTVEIALCDIMVREPYVQAVLVAQTTESAPKEFSEELRKWLKDEMKEAKLTVSPTEINYEWFSARLRPGLLICTVGGTARKHVDDVLAGNTEESLTKVERFKRWNQNANADYELWADVKALRAQIDRMGEEKKIDGDLQSALDAIEFKKWDLFTMSVSLPTKNGLPYSMKADVTFSPGLESVAAVLKPSANFRLVRTMPAETIGFVGVQLGDDAERTWTDVLKLVHDTEQRSQSSSNARRLQRAKDDLARTEEQLRALENPEQNPEKRDGEKDKDKDAAAPEFPPEPKPRDEPGKPKDMKERLKDQIARQKEEIAELEKQAAGFKVRPFITDKTTRGDSSSDAEEAWDNVEEFFKSIGIERAAVAQAIGTEAVAGVIAPPGPGATLSDLMQSMWYATLDLREGSETVKAKFLDWVLARRLPEGATEAQLEEARKRAEEALFKKVDGGEILREKGPFSEYCVYFGENFVGIAGCEEAALRVLKAASGDRPFNGGLVPGGTTGSKLFYIDLAEVVARWEEAEAAESRRECRFAKYSFGLRKLLKNGFRLSAVTHESTTHISFAVSTGGENSMRGIYDVYLREADIDRAWSHDERMLDEVGSGLSQWLAKNRPDLQAMAADDRAKVLKGVTPQSLIQAEHFSPRDGMKSAFDPAMAARLKAMLEGNEDVLAPAEGKDGSDLSESGFEWFGLPPSWEFAPPAEGKRYYGGWGAPNDVWLVCAHKGAWARGGRAVLVFAGESPRVVWLDEDRYAQLQAANRGGTRMAKFNEPKVVLPKWKVQVQMRHARYQVEQVGGLVRKAAQKAKADGREYDFAFDGTRAADTLEKLRRALADEDDKWFPVEDASQYEIEAKGEKYRVRYKLGDHWMEVDSDGKTKASWETE